MTIKFPRMNPRFFLLCSCLFFPFFGQSQIATQQQGDLWRDNGTHIYNNNAGSVGIGINSPRTKLQVVGQTESLGAFVTGFGNASSDIMVTANNYRSFSGSTLLDGIPNQITSYIQYRSTYGGYLNYQNQGYGFWSQGGSPRMFMEVISGNHGSHSGKLPADSPIADGYLYQQIKGPVGSNLSGPMKATAANSVWLWGVKIGTINGEQKAILDINGQLEVEGIDLNGSQVSGYKNKVGIGTTTPEMMLEVQDDLNVTQISVQGSENRGGMQLGKYGFLQTHIDSDNGHDRILLGSGVKYDDTNNRYDGSSNKLHDRSAIEFLNGGHIAFYAQVGNISSDPHFTQTEWHNLERLRITNDGRVGIGTSSPDAKLVVKGTIKSREVIVEADAGADFVFEEDYELMPLEELENHIRTEKHLPEIASAAEMVEKGVPVAEFQIQLLQKVEELSLYVIDLNKEMESLRQENAQLKAEINHPEASRK